MGTALLTGGTTTTQALTDGVSGFMGIVTTSLEYITGNAMLMVAFSASFVFLAVGLIRRLKRQ